MKIETLTVDGVAYEIREQSMRVVMPLLEQDAKKMATGLVSASVFVNGAPLGDAVMDLGFSVYRKLMEAVNHVYGLDEGNAD